jgi:hypothetical protein
MKFQIVYSFEDTPENRCLFDAQEKAYTMVRDALGDSFTGVKLVGGTVLSRCYLHHRISYDLDFEVRPGTDLEAFREKLMKAGIGFKSQRFNINESIYSQIFGQINLSNGKEVDVSFVEDRWFDLYPAVERMMGDTPVVTEPIEGIYHRKVRTVAGYGGETTLGGRQKKRDVFDLYVLSRKVKPVGDFMKEMPPPFSEENFIAAMTAMDWYKLSNDAHELVPAEEWREFSEIDRLRDAMMEEIGMGGELGPEDYMKLGPELSAKWIFETARDPRLENLTLLFGDEKFAKLAHGELHDLVNNPEAYGFDDDAVKNWGESLDLGRTRISPGAHGKPVVRIVYDNF